MTANISTQSKDIIDLPLSAEKSACNKIIDPLSQITPIKNTASVYLSPGSKSFQDPQIQAACPSCISSMTVLSEAKILLKQIMTQIKDIIPDEIWIQRKQSKGVINQLEFILNLFKERYIYGRLPESKRINSPPKYFIF